jgi:hypothetical protein
MLYFRRVSYPPSLYDEKVKWFGKFNYGIQPLVVSTADLRSNKIGSTRRDEVSFGEDVVNTFIYHFARLEFNNRIYDKFNGIEITQIKIHHGRYVPKSLIYRDMEYPIPNGDKNGIYSVLLQLDNTFTQREYDVLQSLYIRSKENSVSGIKSIVPKVEKRL